MIFFIDSSVLVAAGLTIQPRKLRVFLDQATRDGVKVCTSQVVIDEVVNKYQQKLVDDRKAAEQAIIKLERTTAQTYFFRLKENQVEELAVQYKEQILSIFDDIDSVSRVQPYPTVSHEEISLRARQGRRPYHTGTKDSYRDALIWHSILELLEMNPDEQICFVTNDQSDFCSRDGDHFILHPDLTNELKELGYSPNRVTVLPSIDKVVERHWNFQIASIAELNSSHSYNSHNARQFKSDLESAILTYFESKIYSSTDIDGWASTLAWSEVDVLSVQIRDFMEASAEPSELGRGLVVRSKVLVDAALVADPGEIAISTEFSRVFESVAVSDEAGHFVITITAIVSLVLDFRGQVISEAVLIDGSEDWVLLSFEWPELAE